MDLFLALLAKIFPLYVIIFLGFVAGKYLHVKKESIASVAIYIVTPVVIFGGAYASALTLSTISLPFLTFIVACSLCLMFYVVGKLFFKDSTKNLLAFISGEANVGYFGLPVAIALFDPPLVALYTVAIIGSNLYENSLGFFIAARGHHSSREAFARLIKLPIIYAFILGVLFNALHIQLGPIYIEFANSFKGAYLVLGMMLIGLGLAEVAKSKFDARFISLALIAKFLAWPLLILGILFLDSNFLKFYNADIHRIMLLYSIAPIAANVIAYTTHLKLHPEKASMAVLLSTLFALLYVPLVASLFLK
ncbi:MAG TPA: AEC family transporter [Xanthomonadales bacterium]|nr:AEC family transporter [Xanthomonadales bacterium]